MSDFPALDQQLTISLVEGIAGGSSDSPAASQSGDLYDLVNALIEAIPYFSDPETDSAYYDALSRQLALRLPAAAIAEPPSSSSSSYSYRGSYSNYLQAFYRNVSSTDAQMELQAQVLAAVAQLDNNWWGSYSVAVLTDSCNSHFSIDINEGSLNSNLDSLHSEFLQGLTASYLAVFIKGYAPTRDAFQAILATGQAAQAAEILNDGISSPNFITNSNAVILNAGDDPLAVEWFHYNLWVALEALGYPDVDAAIAQHEAEGLIVHQALGPQNWWSGEYNTWYTQASGSLVYEFAQATMNENFPVEYCWGSPPAWGCMDEDYDDGYVKSLCQWGSLSYFH